MQPGHFNSMLQQNSILYRGQIKASWRNNNQIIAKKGKDSHHKLAIEGIQMWCMVSCRSRWWNRWERCSGFICTCISLGGFWHHTGRRRRFSRIVLVHGQSCWFIVWFSRIITIRGFPTQNHLLPIKYYAIASHEIFCRRIYILVCSVIYS